MQIEDTDQFAFLHIPKCAGTSFYNALGTILSRKWPDITISQESYTNQSPKLIHGHAGFSSILREEKTLSSYYTIVAIREPFERRVSEYYYELRHNIGSGKFQPPLDNMMHRNIMHEVGLNPELPSDMIEEALSRIDLLFPADQVDLAIFFIATALGVSPPSSDVLNTNSRKVAGILPSERHEFIETNQKDYWLYQEAHRRFETLITGRILGWEAYHDELLKLRSAKPNFDMKRPSLGMKMGQTFKNLITR